MSPASAVWRGRRGTWGRCCRSIPGTWSISATQTTRCVEKLLDYGPHDCVILLGAERYSRMTCVLAEMAHDAGCRLIVITDKLTAPFAGDADIVLLADLSSPSPTNSYIGVNFLIEAIAFEFSRTLGVYPQQRLSRLDAYLSELQLY